MSSTPEMTDFEDAEARIKAAYARRKNDPSVGKRSSWFTKGNLFVQQERERKMLDLLARENASDLRHAKILEVGCGTGDLLREFTKWGARPENITGIDLFADDVAEAKGLCAPALRVEIGSGAALPFPDGHFDIVLQSTVFTSVLDAGLRRKIATEMLRVVRREGLILWYDFRVNNPFNKDVAGVKAREIRELFPQCKIDLHRITMAPPLLRALAPVSWMACYMLSKIPFLCSHYLGSIRKR